MSFRPPPRCIVQLLDHGRLVSGGLLAGTLTVVLAHALRVRATAAAGQEAPEQGRSHVVYLRVGARQASELMVGLLIARGVMQVERQWLWEACAIVTPAHHWGSAEPNGGRSLKSVTKAG